MNPLLLPPRLVLRALEDLHAVAAAAGDVTSRLNGIEERAEHIEATMRRAVDVAIAIEHRAGQVLTVAERSVEQFEA
ncbi:MAG TPA: hypothetical protein VLB47_05250, partial [Solirubrobacteraceae bacterium]|nr:hypothetical protein [Solirubrobacteraceae bacterium]